MGALTQWYESEILEMRHFPEYGVFQTNALDTGEEARTLATLSRNPRRIPIDLSRVQPLSKTIRLLPAFEPSTNEKSSNESRWIRRKSSWP
ncbi:hypothetical protein KM043_012988 [Ampulex compressa]|nr:hypothetical protein KM043_012988 [Ampulex compressa]